ncbi:MAG: LamG-like jellyroll fold domain-containing protein [Pseudomonadota bacterium]
MRTLEGFAVEYKHLQFEHVVTVRHQGALIAVAEATDRNSKAKGLYYNVLDLNRQETKKSKSVAESKERDSEKAGHADDPEAWNDSRYWSGFQKLDFPKDVRLAGMSLLTFEAKVPDHSPGKRWTVVSNGGELYLFRSIGGTVYGNRYSLGSTPIEGGEGTKPVLKLKTEVRFRRSRLKDTPQSDKDSPAPFDMDDKPFIEPTMSFHQLLNPVDDLFGVCVAPGHQVGRFRWQFIYVEKITYKDKHTNTLEDKRFCSVSILSSQDGWVDLADMVSARFKIKVHNYRNNAMLKDSPALMIYRPQETAKGTDGSEKILPTAPRLMMAAPMFFPQEQSKSKLVTIDFRLQTSGDGTPYIPEVKKKGGSPTDIWMLHAPIVNKSSTQITVKGPAWSELSAEMGMLDWVETETTPALLDSADGCLHLYTVSKTTKQSHSKWLEVTRYNCSKNVREVQTLGWRAEGSTNGKLFLTGRQVGLSNDHFSAKLTFDPHYPVLRHLYAYTNLKAGESKKSNWTGLSEDWRCLPDEIPDLVAVLNGQASDDPNDPLVQSGARPFFDYRAKHSVYWLVSAAEGRNWRDHQKNTLNAPRASTRFPYLVSKKDANPKLDVVSVVPQRANTKLCDVKLGFTVNDRTRNWGFMLHFKNVPRSPSAFATTLSGNAVDGKPSIDLDWIDVGSKFMVCEFEGSLNIDKISIESATSKDRNKCNISFLRDNYSRIVIQNVSRNPSEMITSLEKVGLKTWNVTKSTNSVEFSKHKYKIKIAIKSSHKKKFENTSVDIRSYKKNIFSYFTVLNNGATQKLEAMTLTVAAALPQSYKATWKPKTPTSFEHNWSDGSAIFLASSDPLPANGATAHLDPPKIDHNHIAARISSKSVSGGWVCDLAPSATKFEAGKTVSATLSDKQQQALIPKGDFSVETWVRSTSRDNRQRIIAAAAADSRRSDDYALGLETSAAIGGNTLELSSSKDSFAIDKANFTKKAFTVAFWVKLRFSTGKNFLTFNPIKMSGSCGLFSGQWLYEHLKADEWHFIAFSVKYVTNINEYSFDSYDDLRPKSGKVYIPPDGTFKSNSLSFHGADSNSIFIRSPALWNRVLSFDELRTIKRLGVAPDSNGLVALYLFTRPEKSGRGEMTISNDAKSQTHHNWIGKVKGKGSKIQDTSDEKLFYVNVSTGGRHIRSKYGVASDNQWTHVAAVCAHNRALAFKASEKQKAVCAEGQNLDPEKAFSIDALIKPTGVLSTCYILSKTDDEGNGYALGLRPEGLNWRLFLDFNLVDPASGESKSFSVVSSAQITGNKPYYVAIGASLSIGEKPLPTSVAGNGDKKEQKEVDYLYTALSSSGKDSSKVTHLSAFAFLTDLSLPETNLNGSAEIQMGGSKASASSKNPSGEWQFQATGERPVYLGCRNPREGGYFDGEIGMVRFWERNIAADAPALATEMGMPHGVTPPAIDWRFNTGEGKTVADVEGSNSFTLDSSYMRCYSRLASELKLFVDGREVEHVAAKPEEIGSYGKTASQILIGAGESKSGAITEPFLGQMRDVRIWGEARTPEQIADHAFSELHGDEKTLLCYWPLNKDGKAKGALGAHMELKGLSSFKTWSKTVAGNDKAYLPPIGTDMPMMSDSLNALPTAWQATGASPATAAEYGELQTDEAGLLQGVMKRGYAYVNDKNACVLVTGFKVGDVAMDYIGQMQTRPQLHGYIEGAPPLPSENLTRPYWTSTTSYQSYSGASRVELVEADNTLRSLSADKTISLNNAIRFAIGPAFNAKIEGGIGVYTLLLKAGARPFTAEASTDFKFSHLKGANVSSGNTKTLNNSLAASGDWEKWDKKSPIQKHFGRRYIPDNVGYALVKSRVANLYVLRLKTTGSVIGMQLLPDPDIPEDFNVIMFQIEPTYTKQGTLDGKIGFFNDPKYPQADQEPGSYFKPKEAYSLIADIEAEEAAFEAAYAELDVSDFSKALGNSPKSNVDYGPDDPVEWRKERKTRNMVNSYVWTADGGLYTETEQTALTRQESAGGTFDNATSLGIDANASFSPGFFVDGGVAYGFELHSTVTKSKKEGRDFAIKVQADGEGFLQKWNDGKDVKPGATPKGYDGVTTPGKVTAYRFKTFYLAPNKTAFDTFFNEVVDRQWLNGDDPDAAALREAEGRPNEVWRVLHRVTYVAREHSPSGGQPEVKQASPSVPAIDITSNQALIDKLADEVIKFKTGTEAERIGKAVAEYLTGDGSKNEAKAGTPAGGDLKTESTEWKTLVSSKAADTAKKLERAVFLYMRTLGLKGLKENKSNNRKNWKEKERGAA